MSARIEQPAGAGARAKRWGRWLPVCGLLLGLSTVWLFVGERDFLYSHPMHDGMTAKNMALAANLSAQQGFLFVHKRQRADGTVRYELYNRFPIGAFVLIKLAILPFEGDFSAQIAAARALMLVFFCAAAVLAYLGLARITGSRAVALGATLLAFSSFHLLYYADAVSNEMSVDLFAVLLVFHGLVLFEAERGGEREKRRFWQLAGRVGVALLLGWHVYGLLLPFLAFGVVREAAAGWRRGRSASKSPAGRFGAAAAATLRGRSALLGALALLFGAGVLGYNFAREYAALDGRRAVAELPSARSMLKRTGLREQEARAAEERELPVAIKRQFHRIGALCLPFALSGGVLGVDLDEFGWGDFEATWVFWTGVVATFGALVGLAFLPGPRAPPIALALAGFGWAFLVPESMANVAHQYETIFHVGVPLGLFATLLLWGRRHWRPAPAVFAVAAVLVMAASSVALGLRQLRPEAAQAQRAQMAELDAIAKTIQGRRVWFAEHSAVLHRYLKHFQLLDFATAGAFVHYAEMLDASDPEAVGAVDFVLAIERYEVPALLTPDHQWVFLYRAGADASAVLAAMREARRGEHRRLQALAPVVRGEWDIHVVPDGRRAPDLSVSGSGVELGGELLYFKAPCGPEDTKGMFQLRLAPAAESVPWGARDDFQLRHFAFYLHGVMLDNQCLMRVLLPPWPIAAVYAAQFPASGSGAAIWRAVFRLDIDRLRAALGALRRETPAARGEFDVYLRGRELGYMRAPCVAADVRRRFFLHVVPDASARRRRGFDNLDFEFGERGALLDGACVATVPLPDDAIARVSTGQLEADGAVAWRVAFAPDAGTGH